jgi:PAS domain S-box-containing protein
MMGAQPKKKNNYASKRRRKTLWASTDNMRRFEAQAKRLKIKCSALFENVCETMPEVRNGYHATSKRQTKTDAGVNYSWMSDSSGRCTHLSAGWRITGREPAEGLGDAWKASIHPADLERMWAQFEQRSKAREPYEAHYRLRQANGEYLWMRSKGEPRYENDKFAGYAGYAYGFDGPATGAEDPAAKAELPACGVFATPLDKHKRA